MPEYSTEVNRDGAFIFDAAAIRLIRASIARFLGKDPEISIGFVGDHNIQSTDVDGLLTDPYISSRSVESIAINGSTHQVTPPRRASFKVSSESVHMCRVSISGDRDAAALLRMEIEDILNGCMPWYARLFLPSGAAFAGVRLAVGVGICILIVAMLGARYSIEPGEKVDVGRLLFQWSGVGLLLYWTVVFTIRRMFPRLIFDIGKSSERLASSKYWRNTVLVGFILAILAGIASTLISDRLKG